MLDWTYFSDECSETRAEEQERGRGHAHVLSVRWRIMATEDALQDSGGALGVRL